MCYLLFRKTIVMNTFARQLLIKKYGIEGVQSHEKYWEECVAELENSEYPAIAEDFIAHVIDSQRLELLGDIDKLKDRRLHLIRSWRGYKHVIESFGVDLEKLPGLKSTNEQLDEFFVKIADASDASPLWNNRLNSRDEARAEIDRDIFKNWHSESLEEALLTHMRDTWRDILAFEKDFRRTVEDNQEKLGRHLAAAEMVGVNFDNGHWSKWTLDSLLALIRQQWSVLVDLEDQDECKMTGSGQPRPKLPDFKKAMAGDEAPLRQRRSWVKPPQVTIDVRDETKVHRPLSPEYHFERSLVGAANLYWDLLSVHAHHFEVDDELTGLAAILGSYWIAADQEMPRLKRNRATYVTITHLDEIRNDIELAQCKDEYDDGDFDLAQETLLEELTEMIDRLEKDPRFKGLLSGELSKKT